MDRDPHPAIEHARTALHATHPAATIRIGHTDTDTVVTDTVVTDTVVTDTTSWSERAGVDRRLDSAPRVVAGGRNFPGDVGR